MGIQFGSFDSICETAALVICPLIGSDHGIEPICYSRNVEISGKLFISTFDMFRTRSCTDNDRYHDISHTEQVHSSGEERNRDVLLLIRNR